MEYKIYQIKDFVNTPYAYRSYEEAEKHFNLDDYAVVYEGTLGKSSGNYWGSYEYTSPLTNEERLEALEWVFDKFNCDRPHDFYGHSLSVSDVVWIEGEGFYYCDSFGWEQLNPDKIVEVN